MEFSRTNKKSKLPRKKQEYAVFVTKRKYPRTTFEGGKRCTYWLNQGEMLIYPYVQGKLSDSWAT